MAWGKWVGDVHARWWPGDWLEDSGKGWVRNDEAERITGVWWRPLEGLVQEQKQQDFKAVWQWGEGPGEKGRVGGMFHHFSGCFSMGLEAPSQHPRPLASSQVPHSLMGYRDRVSSAGISPDQQIRRSRAPWGRLREKGQWPLVHSQTIPSSASWNKQESGPGLCPTGPLPGPRIVSVCNPPGLVSSQTSLKWRQRAGGQGGEEAFKPWKKNLSFQVTVGIKILLQVESQ